jgi:peptidyl-prolyl cis-trans isomerase-like protein 2
VCTADGTIFDIEVISQWLEKHGTNPVNGQPLKAADLIKLNFYRNGDVDAHAEAAGVKSVEEGKGEMCDPVTMKVFTDNTHIIAIRHGQEANVFAYDTIDRLNIKAKMWKDLVDDRDFTRADIITLQDPQNLASRDMSKFKHMKDGETVLSKEQEEERKNGSINVAALGRVGEKVLKAKEAVERARAQREAGGDVNRMQTVAGPSKSAPKPEMHTQKKLAYNAAQHTTGKAAASFTSTGLTPETSAERAVLTEEEYMLKPKRVRIKGYAKIKTEYGDLEIELDPEYAPKACYNFVQLARKGYYNGVPFHRNLKGFMIQGGDPTGSGRGGESIWGKPFEDELEGPAKPDARGVICMANRGKHTNGSQFFILYAPASHLINKHTVFARVIGNSGTLDVLEKVPVEDATSGTPEKPITMLNVSIYIDPFAQFKKERDDAEREKKRLEEIRKNGGTADDHTTWTGKRIRDDGTIDLTPPSIIGRYINLEPQPRPAPATATAISARQREKQKEEDPYVAAQEPPKKKPRGNGGFGNFDNW